MNLLNKLTKKNLLLNKKRTVVTIIGIVLSVALLTAVSSMYSSVLQSLINFEKYEKGDFHVLYKNVDENGYEVIKNNRNVDDLFITNDIGYAVLNESQNDLKPYAFIKGFTKDALEHLSIKLVEGRLPENDSEILIPTHLKTNGRVEYHVGDSISLDVGERVSENYHLNQNNPFIIGEEEIINTNNITYKVVGIMERPATNIESYESPGYTFATLISDNVNSGDIYVKYNKNGSKEPYKTTAEILEVDPVLYEKYYSNELLESDELDELNKELEKAKYETDINYYLILLETNPLGEGTMKGLGVVVLIVSIIIIVSSVFCIKNSFDISIVEKSKQYGMLRSIGATRKQIRKNVLYEAFILGIIGIPLGILLGLLAAFILCFVCTYLLKDFAMSGFDIPFTVNYIALLFSIILGIITIYLSAIKSAIKASYISPIDSIRNSGNIKIKNKKTPKIISKLFGIGGVISYKNIKRNKKKYRTTIVSIIVSTTIFIALSYFINLFYNSIQLDIGSYDINIAYNYNVSNDNDMKKIYDSVELDLVEDYVIIHDRYSNVLNVKSVKNDKFQEQIDEYNYNFIVVSIGDYQYNKYINKLKLNDDIKDKGILYDYFTLINDKDKDTLHTTYYNVGDYVELVDSEYDENNTLVNQFNYKLEIGAVVEEVPFSFNASNMVYPILVVSESKFKEIYPESNSNYQINILASDPDKYQDVVEKELFEDEDIYVVNLNEQKKMMDKFLLLICIFLYGFIIVVTLIGITNIFNTITTNMELRKPEFAMLKSIGMTTKEFNRMIRLETIFICMKALVISVVLGIAISYLIYYYLARGSLIKFSIPLLPIICSTIGVLIIIYIIMKFSIRKISKQNTIETIRNENI